MNNFTLILTLVLLSLQQSLLLQDQVENNEIEDVYRRDFDYSDQIKLISRRSIGSLVKSKSSKKSDYRKNETDSLIRNIKKAKKKLKDKSPKEFKTSQIRDLIGDGNHVILFDCAHPSYIDSRGKTTRIHSFKKDLLNEIKISNNCSLDDNLWHNNSSLSTYNVKAKSLSNLPFQELISYFLALNLCDDFMSYIKHPGYFVTNYKKPQICSKSILGLSFYSTEYFK